MALNAFPGSGGRDQGVFPNRVATVASRLLRRKRSLALNSYVMVCSILSDFLSWRHNAPARPLCRSCRQFDTDGDRYRMVLFRAML